MANTLTKAINNMNYRQRGGTVEARINYDGIQKSFYGQSKHECKTKARVFFNQYYQKSDFNFAAKTWTLGEYMEYWLETYKKPSLEPSSYARLLDNYQCQIKKSCLAKMDARAITTKDIQLFINDCAYGETRETPQQRKKRMELWRKRKKKTQSEEEVPDIYMTDYYKELNKVPLLLAKSGLYKMKNILNPCFDKMVFEKIRPDNPCAGIVIPSQSNVVVETREQFSMDDEQIASFVQTAFTKTKFGIIKYRDYVVLVLVLFTGMRIGEMLALEWSDIVKNETDHHIHIHRTLQTRLVGREKCRVKDGTKTSYERFIPLNEEIEYCLSLLKEFDSYHDIKCNYVACTRASTRQNPRNIARSIAALNKKAGITENVTPHTLRHTFGSTLIRNGIGVEVVSKLLGHSKITITYNKYTHIINKQRANAMELIGIYKIS